MNLRYHTIIFDIDGTLTDSFEGIAKSVQYALHGIGIEADFASLGGFVGPPLRNEFKKEFALDGDALDTAVALFRERFDKTGIYENRLYDGVREMLLELKARGALLAVASAKPQPTVDAVLKIFGIGGCFDAAVGALEGVRSEKAEMIAGALARLGIGDTRCVLMVGDRKYDAEGARLSGLDFCGVLYGYGGLEELAPYQSVYYAKTVGELARFLMPEQEA
ncbi:MAG: HAD hydrolase-like protein [Clostridia bacterium]|nr:HAD hydrolase-like protein [Clostridia bacterium]MDR3645283.1 HAD hydrolase-like protein [Clostridia bacterium]